MLNALIPGLKYVRLLTPDAANDEVILRIFDGLARLTRLLQNRHGDARSNVEGYMSPRSAKLVVSPPATMK
jgi:hypothetical protein